MRRVLVTGSRNWTDQEAVFTALLDQWEKSGGEMVVIHGGARGADQIAHGWATTTPDEMGVSVEVHPADWGRHGKAAGFIRNQQMVDAGADVCLAFPLGKSPGTRHCMKAAERAGIPVINYGEREQ